MKNLTTKERFEVAFELSEKIWGWAKLYTRFGIPNVNYIDDVNIEEDLFDVTFEVSTCGCCSDTRTHTFKPEDLNKTTQEEIKELYQEKEGDERERKRILYEEQVARQKKLLEEQEKARYLRLKEKYEGAK
tara:strand:+ start:2273 stop:2665 length:393 start_codon:yes stop_codon:yes gene_type:complete